MLALTRVLARYRAYRGEPMRRPAELVWLLDEMLDRIPAWQDGRLYLCGQWGCQWGLSRIWARDLHTTPKGPP
jgi:hypothetical protein